VPSVVIPTFRVRDAHAMIDWLRDVFSFEARAVHEDGQGGVAHAELALSTGMVMLGSAPLEAPDDATPTTDARASRAYLVLSDDAAVEAAHARALAAGAEILQPPEAQPHGGLAFACRDPEGGIWNAGSYDPWG
jgi:uncharacterized glyoxalase superfamily protein PhnB